MTPAQAHLVDQLRARFGPRIATTDTGDIEPWLTDWRGRWHGAAPALLQPDSVEAVAAIVALAREGGVALTPQGGNSSMVGGATPPADGSALILSLRRLNAIRAIAPGHALAEAGVILETLHQAAADTGQRFPLTLGAKGSATIGGLVSTNAGGTQVLRFGPMRSLVEGLEAVLPDGSIHHGLTGLKKDNRGPSLDQLLVGAEGTGKRISRIGADAVIYQDLEALGDRIAVRDFHPADAHVDEIETAHAQGLEVLLDSCAQTGA